jgi:hypothetical protein
MPQRVAGHARPQASARVPVPGEVSVTHEADPAGPAGHHEVGVLVNAGHDRCDVSRVYVFKQKILPPFSALAGVVR